MPAGAGDPVMTIIALAGEPEPEGEDRAQQQAAQARVAERAAARNATESVLGFEGGVAAANTPERVARRLDRLSRYYLDGSTDGVDAAAPVDSHRVLARAGALTGENESAGRAVEAIINTSDFIGVRYLDAGVAAARSVGRINISHGRGYGTGFLVSPILLLTNHHVLPTADKAHTSTVEFDYQDDVDGSPRPVRAFELDPDTFYVSDRDLDFALTAVKGTPEQLQPFGFRSLTEAQGTVVIGEFTTIVQHPRGDKKMIALRENTLVDILDRYLHYCADTEPGSSGSPVFNDQWEVVALHHASVPAPDHAEFGGIVNEGIRISQIIAMLRARPFSARERELLTPLIGPASRTAMAVPATPDFDDAEIDSGAKELVDVRETDLRNRRCPVTVTVTIDTAAQPMSSEQKATEQ